MNTNQEKIDIGFNSEAGKQKKFRQNLSTKKEYSELHESEEEPEEISQRQIQIFSKLLSCIVEKEAEFLITMYSTQNNTSHRQPAINIIIPCASTNSITSSYNFPALGALPITYPNQIYNPVNTPASYNMSMISTPYPYNISNPYTIFNSLQQNSNLSTLYKNKDKKKKDKRKKDKKKKDKKDKKKKDTLQKVKYEVFECSSGIFSYLFTKYGQNPVLKGLITIEGDSDNAFNSERLPSLIDTNFTSDWMSRRLPNPKVKINFSKCFVKINKYRIAIGFKGRGGIFKNWILKGVTKDDKTVILDDVNNSPQVSESNREITNPVSNDSYLRSIELQMKGDGSQAMLLRNIEIFGSIKIEKNQ